MMTVLNLSSVIGAKTGDGKPNAATAQEAVTVAASALTWGHATCVTELGGVVLTQM